MPQAVRRPTTYSCMDMFQIALKGTTVANLVKYILVHPNRPDLFWWAMYALDYPHQKV